MVNNYNRLVFQAASSVIHGAKSHEIHPPGINLHARFIMQINANLWNSIKFRTISFSNIPPLLKMHKTSRHP